VCVLHDHFIRTESWVHKQRAICIAVKNTTAEIFCCMWRWRKCWKLSLLGHILYVICNIFLTKNLPISSFFANFVSPVYTEYTFSTRDKREFTHSRDNIWQRNYCSSNFIWESDVRNNKISVNVIRGIEILGSTSQGCACLCKIKNEGIQEELNNVFVNGWIDIFRERRFQLNWNLPELYVQFRLSVVSCVRMTPDGVLDWILDLLIT
jgi:hypothetical protein